MGTEAPLRDNRLAASARSSVLLSLAIISIKAGFIALFLSQGVLSQG
jgi:hypothetical protein